MALCRSARTRLTRMSIVCGWRYATSLAARKRGIAVARSGDLDYKEFGRSQKDMEFGAGREFASKVIGRTLGFPDGYWSDLANRANAEQARRTMISGAVWPLLVRLAEDMNAQIAASCSAGTVRTSG
jgi:phage portal protein BeeE